MLACYSSEDLAHWQFRNRSHRPTDADGLRRGWVLERPKVFYNERTEKFVMYTHIDSHDISGARGCVAICDTVDGNYNYLQSFRPLNQESRDIGQFMMTMAPPISFSRAGPRNGFPSRSFPTTTSMSRRNVCLIPQPWKAGHWSTIRVYYVIGSHFSGWSPNPNVYATAQKLEGPWTPIPKYRAARNEDLRLPITFHAPESRRNTQTSVIFMGDIWKPRTQWDSRYLWMPVKIGDAKFTLPEPREWTLDVSTGQSSIQTPPAAASPSP